MTPPAPSGPPSVRWRSWPGCEGDTAGGRVKGQKGCQGSAFAKKYCPREGNLRAERRRVSPTATKVCGFVLWAARARRSVWMLSAWHPSFPPAAPGGFDQVILKKVPCKKGWQSLRIVNLFQCGKQNMGSAGTAGPKPMLSFCGAFKSSFLFPLVVDAQKNGAAFVGNGESAEKRLTENSDKCRITAVNNYICRR